MADDTAVNDTIVTDRCLKKLEISITTTVTLYISLCAIKFTCYRHYCYIANRVISMHQITVKVLHEDKYTEDLVMQQLASYT